MFLTEKKSKNYDSFFRKNFLDVYEIIPFKVFDLLIKVHLNNQKLQSNLLNPEYTQFTSAFICAITQNQSNLYFNLDIAEVSI